MKLEKRYNLHKRYETRLKGTKLKRRYKIYKKNTKQNIV